MWIFFRLKHYTKHIKAVTLVAVHNEISANSMEQRLPWEANRSSSTQENPRILWKPKVHCLIHNSPPPVPYQEPDRSSPCPHPTFLRSILISSFHLRLGLSSGLLVSGFPIKPLRASVLSPLQISIYKSFNYINILCVKILIQSY